MRLANCKFHFVGVGGIGMSGLAELLLNMGARVSGSDLKVNPQTRRLKELGAVIHTGHKAGQVGDADVVVYSSAVSLTNPEIQEARTRKIPIIPRAEVLAEIMRLKRGIAVGGSHGKTTTTSLIASVLLNGGLDPTIVVGGRLDLIKSTSVLGCGEWLVVEADESDGSFLKLSPEIAVITNIDNDHLDHYKEFSRLQTAFMEFALKIPFYGRAIVWGDDPKTRKLFDSFNKPLVFYGFDKANDYYAEGGNGAYVIYREGIPMGRMTLQIAGRHNALNALAALVVGMDLGLGFEKCAEGIAKFRGVDRRFHFKGEAGGVKVYDDYGHHPTEIQAVMQAFCEKHPAQRLVVIFQPHRYSRTQLCWEQFLSCFQGAGELFICDIYPADEKPIEGITAERLALEIRRPQARTVGSADGSWVKVLPHLRPGDVVVTLGAGDISLVGPKILEGLQ